MTSLLGFLTLLVLLFAGSAGWGNAASLVSRRAGWYDAPVSLNLGLRVSLGVALFLAAGGWLVAAGIGWFGVLLAWHVVGCVFLLFKWTADFRHRSRDLRWAAAAYTTGVLLAGAFLALVAFGRAIGMANFNGNDDDGAYIYLATRLLRTGALIDAFNQRRLVSLGGETLYDALFLRFAGNASEEGFELVFATLLIALLLGSGRARNVRTLVVTVLLALGLLVGRDFDAIANLSPVFSAGALTLATFQILIVADLGDRRQRRGVYAAAGLLLAGLLALRFTFAIPVGLAMVVFSFGTLRFRKAISSLAVTLLSALVFVSGWMVASYESSRTPMFPLISGNYDTSWPGSHNRTGHGFDFYWRILLSVLRAADTGWLLVAVAIVVLVVAAGRSRPRPVLFILVGALTGSVVEVVLFVYEFSGSATYDIWRFLEPTTLACGLLAVQTVWPKAGTASKQSALAGGGSLESTGHRSGTTSHGARALATAAGVIALSALLFGTSLRTDGRGVRTRYDIGIRVLRHPSTGIGFLDRYATLRPTYAAVNALVPRGAKVLAAVSYPALLDFSKYRFATLDLPGSVSPEPHMPYFRGVQAKADYLTKLGYTYVVADLPTTVGLYTKADWDIALVSPYWAFKAWAPYVLDWDATVDQLVHRRGARQIDGIVVVPLATS